MQLITTDTIKDFYGYLERNIRELIRQEVQIDWEAGRTGNKWMTMARIFYGLAIGLFIAFVILNY